MTAPATHVDLGLDLMNCRACGSDDFTATDDGPDSGIWIECNTCALVIAHRTANLAERFWNQGPVLASAQRESRDAH